MTHGNRFIRILCFLLIGYALLGKGFAYLGVPPLYVGEMTMAYGIYALLVSENWSRILRTAWLWPVIALMGWGALRTIPFLATDGVDALHDAAMWIWGLFAIVMSSLIAADPSRLRYLESKFRVFAKWLLIIAPFSFVLTNFSDDLPRAFWADVPYVLVKGGDLIVHLTGIFAFAVLLGGINLSLLIPTLMVNLMLYFTGRASIVTFCTGAAIVTALRPKSIIPWCVFPAMVMGVVLLWVFNIHVVPSSRQPDREVSAEQIVSNVTSIFSDSDQQTLSGSKAWRLAWWDTIIKYTVHGKYFWKGKGFGINLADDDGFQVEADHSLRNPHNGHLTILARGGVPMFAIWVVCQLTLGFGLASSAYLARRRGDAHWFGFLVFLFIYFLAFLVNASFDVFLESPVGGIWYWCVYGIGIGSVWVYRNCPQALHEPASAAPPAPRRRLFKENMAVCAS
jgi:O-Antigen ligase